MPQPPAGTPSSQIVINVTFYKGKFPVLNFCRGADDKYPFSFGVAKAQMLLGLEAQGEGKLVEALKEFVERFG